MRKVKAWLVTEASDWIDSLVERPIIAFQSRSAADIRALLESGRYQVADEYGDVWAPGAESLRMLSELCGWRGGPLFTGRPVPYTGSRDAPPGCPYTHAPGPSVYLDPEGYVFDTRWFR